jgi:hypothetical protein
MKLRVIPTHVHALTDYVTGPALAAAPTVFRMHDGGPSSLAPRIAAAGATAYSSVTDYELGMRRWLPMRAHLVLDAASGAALAAAPWLFGSARRGKRYWIPHALVGATEVALAVATKTEPERPAPRRFRRLRRVLRVA